MMSRRGYLGLILVGFWMNPIAILYLTYDLLLFHIYLYCKKMTTYDYLVQKRDKDLIRSNETKKKSKIIKELSELELNKNKSSGRIDAVGSNKKPSDSNLKTKNVNSKPNSKKILSHENSSVR